MLYSDEIRTALNHLRQTKTKTAATPLRPAAPAAPKPAPAPVAQAGVVKK